MKYHHINKKHAMTDEHIFCSGCCFMDLWHHRYKPYTPRRVDQAAVQYLLVCACSFQGYEIDRRLCKLAFCWSNPTFWPLRGNNSCTEWSHKNVLNSRFGGGNWAYIWVTQNFFRKSTWAELWASKVRFRVKTRSGPKRGKCIFC